MNNSSWMKTPMGHNSVSGSTKAEADVKATQATMVQSAKLLALLPQVC
ncbi:MAG: hypothetical protein U7123_16180 [Potamolinea sp.]